MSLGSIHEWVGLIGENLWIPPLHVLVHLAGRLTSCSAGGLGGDVVPWIGRRVWPSGHVLGDAIERTLLVDARDVGERLWACEQALRAGFCAVLDGSRVDCAGTRRLQLACEARGGVVLMARPAGEMGALSVSATRWMVRREARCLPSWSIELVRRRGGLVGGGRWIVEFHHARGLECVSGDVERGSGEQAGAERVGGGSRVRADPSRRASA